MMSRVSRSSAGALNLHADTLNPEFNPLLARNQQLQYVARRWRGSCDICQQFFFVVVVVVSF